MTAEEEQIIKDLGNVWSDFLRLDVLHSDDNSDFRKAIHQAQRIIASRDYLRSQKSNRKVEREREIKLIEKVPIYRVEIKEPIYNEPKQMFAIEWDGRESTYKQIKEVIKMFKTSGYKCDIEITGMRLNINYPNMISTALPGSWFLYSVVQGPRIKVISKEDFPNDYLIIKEKL